MTRPLALAATRAPVSCGFHCNLGSGVGSNARSPKFVRYVTIAATKLIMPAAKKAQPRLFTDTTTPAIGPSASPSNCAAMMREIARPRSLSEKRAATADIEATSIAPADAPWTARARANHAADRIHGY